MKLISVEEFLRLRRGGKPAKAVRGDGSRYGKKDDPHGMNGTETEYAGMLELRLRAGDIRGYSVKSVTFKLTTKLRFTPDFEVVHLDGSIEFVDVKGSGPINATSTAKIKMAAKLFPWYGWFVEQKRTKKQGGGWVRIEYKN